MAEGSKELTILHEIVSNFKEYSSKTAFFWLDKDCELVSSISYKELDLVTQDIATELLKVTSEGNYSSKTVVLCYTQGPEFISAFLGCLRAGLIPVPVKSPGTTELYYKRSLQDVVKVCGASFVLSNKHLFKGQDEAKTTILTRLMEATRLEWFAVSDPAAAAAAASNVIPEEEEGEEDREEELQGTSTQDQEPAVELDKVKTEDVAFLQFTTTEKPKGVMVTYKNLQHNFKLMDSCYGTSCDTTELCLLPHYNGFALVGSYLHILHTGASAFFISPQDFYQRPASWMEATSKFRISHAKIPSCAFIESIYVYLKNIDLSSLECISCLEPILPEDITTFEQCMVQNFNLKRNIVSVSYGLAEHVALVCSSNIHNTEGRIAIKNRSSCGKPASDVTVKIVHPTEGFEMIEGDVGEIWVSSPSKAVGYYTDRNCTKETFHARLHNRQDKNQYLRTADLGFMANGELFIVETMSEVLNLEGRTIYPIDIESSIESILPSLSHCKSIMSNNPIHPDNQLLFIAELRSPSYNKRSYDNFRREVLTHIYHEFKLVVGTVVFFSPFSIPCTTFGKRQRSLSYKLCLTTDAQIYKWTKPKSEDLPIPTVLTAGKVNLSPVREDEQLSPTPPQVDLIPKPSTDSRSTSPTLEDRLSPLPDDRAPSAARTRRVSAPAMPLSQTLPKVSLPRLKRAKSGDFMGRSGITLILHIAAKTMGHSVSPNDLIWEEGSPLVEEMSVMLKEKCGFNIDYGTMLLAQSPEALLAVMKMSLLSSEPVIKRHKPFRLSFSTTPPPIFESTGTSYHSNNDIAIVGIGGIFADCTDAEELWKLMALNQSAITTRQGGFGGKKYTGCFSKIPTHFDNTQYGLQDSEIASLDPHQMMLLHCTRECIKSAGFAVDPKDNAPADWGVFAGISPSSSQAANCISHAFNLTGPMMALNCEHTSLSPLSVACHHLQLKQCSAAIVCGARAFLSASDFPTSPNASFPPGEGCAAVLLMSVGLARKFNRRILAVVKGTASNCDDPSSQRSQTGLLKHAFQEAGLTAKDISFVEADLRGTKQDGTAHLDSIQNAFLPQREEEEGVSGDTTTTVGSVKVNIGDLGAASGVAALLRTVMVLEHALLPGSASRDVPSPPTSHSKVKTFSKEAADFSGHKKLLTGVVTSFGVTGCNEAAVIQEYSILPHMSGVSSWLILGADHMIGDRFWLLSEATRKSSCYAEIFGSLKAQFPLIQNALVHFNQTFQLACDKYRFKPHQKIAANFNVAVLKLYYGIFTQLSASGIKFSVLGGTNATNEVVALLFAGSIDLSTAILFMCCKSLQRGRERPMNFSASDHPDDSSVQTQQDLASLQQDPSRDLTHLSRESAPDFTQKHPPTQSGKGRSKSPVQKSRQNTFPFQKTVLAHRGHHKPSRLGQDPIQKRTRKLSRSEEVLVQNLPKEPEKKRSHTDEEKLSHSEEDFAQKLTNPGQEPEKKLSHSDEDLVQKLTNPGQKPEKMLSSSDEDFVEKLTYPGQEPKKLSHSDEDLSKQLLKKSTTSGQNPQSAQNPAHSMPVLKQKLLMKHSTENPKQQQHSSSKHSGPIDSTETRRSTQKKHDHGEESVQKPTKLDKDPGKKPAYRAEHFSLKSTTGENSSQKPKPQDRNPSKKQVLPGKGKNFVQKRANSGEGSVQKPSLPGDSVKKHDHLSEDHTQKPSSQKPTPHSNQDPVNPGKEPTAAEDRDPAGEGHITQGLANKDPVLTTTQPEQALGSNTKHQGEDSSQQSSQSGQTPLEEPTHSSQQDEFESEDLDDDPYEKLTQSSKLSKGSETTLSKSVSVNPSMLVKLISKPKIPVFSCIENKILSPDMFTDKVALTRYAMNLVENVGKPTHPRIYLDFLVAKGDREPLLYVTSDEDIMAGKESIFTISFKHLQDTNNSSRYLREAYLKLRRFSDTVKVKKDAPLQRNDITSNGLYERYPFRKIVEGLEKPKKKLAHTK